MSCFGLCIYICVCVCVFGWLHIIKERAVRAELDAVRIRCLYRGISMLGDFLLKAVGRHGR